MRDDKRRVLFLCTGNACRSQMAEAMLAHWGRDQFLAYSAGSNPAGFVHPLAMEALGRMNIPLREARSKSWDEFRETPIDLVITLCDSAAGQACPHWAGAPLTVHWSLPDPVYHGGMEEERMAFTMLVAQRLESKIRGLMQIDWSALWPRIEERLHFLGDI